MMHTNRLQQLYTSTNRKKKNCLAVKPGRVPTRVYIYRVCQKRATGPRPITKNNNNDDDDDVTYHIIIIIIMCGTSVRDLFEDGRPQIERGLRFYSFTRARVMHIFSRREKNAERERESGQSACVIYAIETLS